MNEFTSRRAAFNRVAADYDAIRPGYPKALIEDIITLSGLPENGRILEIGCGTGQATLPFAQRGYAMTCLDIGPEMAALARQKCRLYPQVDILNISFEDWPLEESGFDLVMSATAFHWIQPEIGYPKVARSLRGSGSMAIFANEHPAPYTGFFAAVQSVYAQVVPEWTDPRDRITTEEKIQATAVTIDETGLFEPVHVRRYPWQETYTVATYLQLLNTYSEHRGLEKERRQRLFEGIGELIEREFNGRITKQYLAVLYLAQRSNDK